jgi:hypothetical protein
MALKIRAFICAALALLIFTAPAAAQTISYSPPPASMIYGPTYYATANGLACDGVTDDGPALNALITKAMGATGAGNGGTIVFSGACKIITPLSPLPNAGVSPNGVQPPLRLTGQAVQYRPGGITIPWYSGGGRLDFDTGATSTANIDTRGNGILEIDHLTLSNAADCATFVHTTSTNLNIHDVNFEGSASGFSACNDGIIFGGSGAQGTSSFSDGFRGYGSWAHHNLFQQTRRAAVFGNFANSISFTDNYIGGTTGSNTTTAVTSCTNATPVVCTIPTHTIPVGSTTNMKLSGFTGNWTPLNGTHVVTSLTTTTVSIAINSTGFGAVTGTPVFYSGAAIDLPGGTGVATINGNRIERNLIEVLGYAYGINCDVSCARGNTFAANDIWDVGDATLGGYKILGGWNNFIEGHTDLQSTVSLGTYPSTNQVSTVWGATNVNSLSILGQPLRFNSTCTAGAVVISSAQYTFGRDASSFTYNCAGGVGIGAASITSPLTLNGAALPSNPTLDVETTGSGQSFAKVAYLFAKDITSGQHAQYFFGVNTSTNNFLELRFDYAGGSGSASNCAALLMNGTADALKICGDNSTTLQSLAFTGTAPAVTGTGSPTIAAGSTDSAGEVTGGTLATSIVITFAAAKTNAPFCTVTSQASVTGFSYSISTTAITISLSATSGEKVDYVCFQH